MIIYIVITVALVVLSALFSGLTLGLMGLNVHDLKRKADLGDDNAATIYPIRKEGNLLLTTLLLGNVAVNTVLAVLLADFASGLVASLVATSLIFIFGEIIPQAVISRYALSFGARMVPFVKTVRFVLYPIVFPLALILDHFLSDELPTVYSHNELIQIVAEHEDHPDSPIDIDEERILHGALQFSHKTVSEIMTHIDQVFSLEISSVIDNALCEEIKSAGFSRIPLFYKDAQQIVGVVHVRDLVGVQGGTLEDYKEDCMTVNSGMKLDLLMNSMLRKHQHIAAVLDTVGDLVGVVTLEDVLEEVIGREILDEDDELV
jgi:metal transporter CNNM